MYPSENLQNPSSKARETRNREDEGFEQDGGYSHCKYQDYSFIDLLRKALETFRNESTGTPFDKKQLYSEIVYYEAHREYHQGGIKEFKALEQVGTPDHDLREAKWELFKITMSDITRDSVVGRIKCECMILTVIVVNKSVKKYGNII